MLYTNCVSDPVFGQNKGVPQVIIDGLVDTLFIYSLSTYMFNHFVPLSGKYSCQ